jgi:AMMECR1 domain-containing protein
MQPLLLCLTTLLCLALTYDWSPYCNGPIEKSLLIKPPDSSCETIVVSAQLDDRNGEALVLAKNENPSVTPLERKAPEIETRASDSKLKAKPEQIEASLPEISRLTILHHFHADENDSWKGLALDELAKRFVVKKEHLKDSGLFVTLIKNGDTRACWGGINATHKNLVEATVFTTEDALNKDYRYTKIKKSEINLLIPQVTVVKRIVPINSISTMQPLKQGLMVRAGGKGAVLLPGEASDPHYQLVKTKLKAGIPSSQHCQMYKIEADVYR